MSHIQVRIEDKETGLLSEEVDIFELIDIFELDYFLPDYYMFI